MKVDLVVIYTSACLLNTVQSEIENEDVLLNTKVFGSSWH